MDERRHQYHLLNTLAKKGQILFTGSSLMEQFPINELLMSRGLSKIIYNRGISGYTTTVFLQSMDEMVFELAPAKIFINIGSNDIAGAGAPYSLQSLLNNYRQILTRIKNRLPATPIYIMAYYPVNPTLLNDPATTRTNPNIQTANQALQHLATQLDCQYININQGLTNLAGNLKPEYTIEGIHLRPNAYNLILDNLLPYL